MANNNPTDGSNERMQELVDLTGALRKEFTSLGAEMDQTIRRDLGKAGRKAKEMQEHFRDAVKDVVNLGKSSKTLVENEKLIATGQLKSKDIANQIIQKKQQEQAINARMQILMKNRVMSEQLVNDFRERLKKTVGAELEVLNEQLKVVKKRETAEKRVQATIKAYTGLVQMIGKIPILGSLVNASAVQEKMTKYAKEYQERTKKVANQWRVLGVGILETFNSIGKSMLLAAPGLLIAGIKAIIKMVMEWEQTTFDIAKNIGVSVSQAEKFRNVFSGITGAGLTSKQVGESYAKITDQLGFLGPANDAFAGTAAKIEKRIGGSADAMAGLATAGALAGMNLNKAYATVIGYAKVSGARNKLALTERQIIGEIAKTSSAVLVNFKGNLPALAEAVVRAKKLGTTLDQIAKQGDALLDFENSIAAQFEAEVLTGREINLNKARELALLGKTAELGEELAKQSVTLETFGAMDMLAKEATAKSVGLTTEELSKQLVMQRQAVQLGAQQGQTLQNRYNQMLKEGKTRDQIARTIGQSEEAELNRVSTAERLEAIMFRLKETLASMVAGPVLGLVNQMVTWLSSAVNIKKVADGIKYVFEGLSNVLKNLPGYLETAVKVAKVLAGISLARAVFSIIASMAAAGPLAGGIALLGAGYIATQLVSSIPKFATGGIVEGNGPATGDKILGRLNPGEMVLNDNQQARLFQMANGGGKGPSSAPIQITVNTVLNGEIVAKNVIEHMPKLKTGTTDGTTSQYSG
jgi:hypothetical protein